MKLIKYDEVPTVPASHEDPSDPGALKKVMARLGDLGSGHIQMLNWAVIAPHKSFRNHYHEDMQEIFIMVGEGAVALVDGTRIPVGKGDVLVVDPGEQHEMTNPTDIPFEYIVFGISGSRKGKSVNV